MNYPIMSIDGVSLSCIPTSMKYGIKEVAANSGRTLDDKYHKNEPTKKRTLEFEWSNIDDNEISTLLNMFDKRYLSIEYYDAKDKARQTRQFVVVSNSEMPVTYLTVRDKLFKSVSFKLEER